MSQYSCPACGWKTDELPEPVREYGPTGTHTAGHSDQMTHLCPKCDHEGWNQGWYMDGTPEAD